MYSNNQTVLSGQQMDIMGFVLNLDAYEKLCVKTIRVTGEVSRFVDFLRSPREREITRRCQALSLQRPLAARHPPRLVYAVSTYVRAYFCSHI